MGAVVFGSQMILGPFKAGLGECLGAPKGALGATALTCGAAIFGRGRGADGRGAVGRVGVSRIIVGGGGPG